MNDLKKLGNSMALVEHLEYQELSFDLLESFCIGVDRRVLSFFLFTRICIFSIGDHLHDVEVRVVMIGIIGDEPTFIEGGAGITIFHGKADVSVGLSFMAADDLIAHPISVEEMEVGVLHRKFILTFLRPALIFFCTYFCFQPNSSINITFFFSLSFCHLLSCLPPNSIGSSSIVSSFAHVFRGTKSKISNKEFQI